MNTTSIPTLALTVVAGLLMCARPTPAHAQPAQRSTESGSELYTTYCASCHGPTAHGDGQIAMFLRVKPADLTLIAKRNKGTFDSEKVSRIIDGRESVKPHGKADKSEMPVWGDAFMKSSMTGGEEKAVSERIRLLVEYLQTIQEKSAR
jgi:mono/diheme cytochrome c family protein